MVRGHNSPGMKVLVEELRCGFTPTGEGALQLYGLNYCLSILVPGIMAVKIAEARNPHLRVDPRRGITDLLEDEIRRLGVKSLFINHISEGGVYSAALEAGGSTYEVVPSEGVLLCSLTGAPICFESELRGVESMATDVDV